MAATSYKVISSDVPNFIVEYRNGDKTTRVTYSVYMLPKEIEAQMPYILFKDESPEPDKLEICEDTALGKGIPFEDLLNSYLALGYVEESRYNHPAVGVVVKLSKKTSGRPKIWVKRSKNSTGSTIGAFLYTYLIRFKEDGYSYDYQMTTEGYSNITRPFDIMSEEIY